MTQSLLLIGGAGTGKTTTLLRTMDKVLETGVTDVYGIGFVSFTRAARREAASRAAEKFGVGLDDLEQNGWFKTLHSVCHRQLSASSQLIADSKKDREWLSNLLGEEVNSTTSAGEDGVFETSAERTDPEVALSLWHHCRNRLTTLKPVWERASFCDQRTPSLDYCLSVIKKYETGKRLDHRMDFTDMLAEYSGWKFSPGGDPSPGTPRGEVPDVPVWFLDEAQDQSALSDAVARRMTSNAKWVYLVGDPYQSIFGFTGADPQLFQNWTDNRKILDQSFRCPKAFTDLGESIIRNCSNYWDRGIRPASHDGSVETIDYRHPWPEQVKPYESWLLLCRSNFIARRLAKRLDASGIPWASVKGNSSWTAPKRNKAIIAMRDMQNNNWVSVEEWKLLMDYLPVKVDGKEILTHGTKAHWQRYDGGFEEGIHCDEISVWGGTDEFLRILRSSRWTSLIPNAPDVLAAMKKWGDECVLEPKVQISTIHGAKGSEADNVLLLTTTSSQVARSSEEQVGRDEELRLGYVAVTRARKRLIIASEPVQHRMEIEA